MSRSKSLTLLSMVGVLFALLFLGSPVHAHTLYTLKAVAHIPNLVCYDIITVHDGTAYLSDDTNNAVDVINGTNVSTLGSGLFTGAAGCALFDFSQEGPEGNLVVGNHLWVGNGDSTVKVFDLTTGNLLASISTRGTHRADEMAYDPTLGQLVVTNPDEPVPFLSYIDTSTLQIVHRQTFSDATALEQPTYEPYTKDLVISVPQTTQHAGGELDVIDPSTYQTLRVYPTPSCSPSGLVLLQQFAATGCANGDDEIVNLITGAVTVVKGSGASDMVAVDPQRHRFFFASYAAALVTITTVAGQVLQQIPTDGNAHSVAVDPTNGDLYIPVGTLGGVAEYTLQKEDAHGHLPQLGRQ